MSRRGLDNFADGVLIGFLLGCAAVALYCAGWILLTFLRFSW